ncbi:hypothetical protein EVAR_93621_1 [Eumeta japonica]|uniref:Uncharacterized protein n=1 Tax=Eumeta variegata TaxID=151549 RepID=A0A4C1TQJ1_EUMVA|nr:hypothetical protein EVAR_93621_1 [Eumeta japonica]
MKAVTVLLSCLLVAACWALPRSSVNSVIEYVFCPFAPALRAQERSAIVDSILQAMENARQDMIESGMEPMHVDEVEYDLIDLGLPGILEGLVRAKNAIIHGITTFRVENMNLALLTTTLTFDLHIDELDAIVEFFELIDGIVDGAAVSGKASGDVQVSNIHVNGRVRLSIGIITGISVRDVNFRLRVGGVKSNVVGEDVQGIGNQDVNEFIETQAMTIISKHESAITSAINAIVMDLLDTLL